MARKLGLIRRHVLIGNNLREIIIDRLHPVHEEERVAMGQELHDLINLHRFCHFYQAARGKKVLSAGDASP